MCKHLHLVEGGPITAVYPSRNLVDVVADAGELPEQRRFDARDLVDRRNVGSQAMLAHPRGQTGLLLAAPELLVFLVREPDANGFGAFRTHGHGRVTAVAAGGKGGRRSIPLSRSQMHGVHFVYAGSGFLGKVMHPCSGFLGKVMHPCILAADVDNSSGH